MLVIHSNRPSRMGCRKCGRKDLYFGHDTDNAGIYPCLLRSCPVNGFGFQFVLLEKDSAGTLVQHIHPVT